MPYRWGCRPRKVAQDVVGYAKEADVQRHTQFLGKPLYLLLRHGSYPALGSALLIDPSSAESFERFLDKRLAGAEKLAESTKAKGGYSTLTAIHYAAKAKPYAECIKLNSQHKEDHEKVAKEAIRISNEKIQSGKYDIVILDEINYAINLN